MEICLNETAVLILPNVVVVVRAERVEREESVKSQICLKVEHFHFQVKSSACVAGLVG